MRRSLVIANWKMHKTVAESAAFLETFLPRVDIPAGVDVVICPPFTALFELGKQVKCSPVVLGAQNVYAAAKGAFTGEISPLMLQELGVRYVIIGHSERRHYLGETDAQVAAKVEIALGYNLIPVICVGEALAQYEAGQAEQVVLGQLKAAIGGAAASALTGEWAIAYEPVWAIGTGRTPTASVIEARARLLRQAVSDACGPPAARTLRVIYGGSVSEVNIGELIANPEIDGVLVGGASLDPAHFLRIVAMSAGADGRLPETRRLDNI